MDGPRQNANLNRLRAVPANTSAAAAGSKLLVGPRFLPRLFYGPYWVVAVSPDKPREAGDDAGEGYDWAVVSGGQPTLPTSEGKCRTGDGVNGSGLWLFSREKVAGDATIAAMMAVLDEKGFDASVLEPVTQEGCRYPDEL